MFSTIWLFVVSINFLFVLSNKDSTWSHLSKENVTITIEDGKIMGTIYRTIDKNNKYFGFRGIPYAEPPIGNLRFQPPLQKRSWMGILDATKDGDSCIQPKVYKYNFSEDCLFINVYTPNLNNNLPVMVWIYGGAFLIGTSSKSYYGPDYFMDKNVVIVTFNYRLGLFGFLSNEDETLPGNYGLKDQILALEWVQKNIRYFGGDSDNVTLFGESAGAASVSLLLQTPLANGLYHRAIMQSGTSLNVWSRNVHPKNVTLALAKALGINFNNTSELLQKLQEVDAKTLSLATLGVDAATILENMFTGLGVAPTVEPDHKGAVFTGFSHDKLKNGYFNKVPILIGFNSGEGGGFYKAVDLLRVYLLSYDLIPRRLIPVSMNLKKHTLKAHMVGLFIKNFYFGRSRILLAHKEIAQFLTDDWFVRPINEFAKLVARFTPTYLYRFSYEGQIPNVNRVVPGVVHGEDLNYIWNTSKNNATKNDLIVRERLVRLWTNFAKTSNPTPTKEDILQNITWYPIRSNGLPFLDIGKNLAMGQFPEKNSTLFWRNLYDRFGTPPYDTF